MEEIRLDATMQSLDPNAQRVIVDAVRNRLRNNTAAPADMIRLLNTTTTDRVTTYDVMVDVGGRIDHIDVIIDNDGNVQVRQGE